MLILKIQREMELKKKEENKRKKPPIARTEPRSSDTSSIIMGSINNDKVSQVNSSEISVERYKKKPSFPRAERFFKIDSGHGSITTNPGKSKDSISPRSH